MRRRTALAAALVFGCTGWIADATGAGSAFPGRNGRIAYVYDLPLPEIRSIGPRGGKPRSLPRPPTPLGSAGAFEPAWSPDGKALLFTGRLLDTRQLYLSVATGSAMLRITGPRSASDPITESFSPAWAPDGKRMVFVREPHDGRPPRLFVADVDGTRLRRLTAPAFPAEDMAPAWSPAGTDVAFLRYSASTRETSDLFVVSADGSNLRQLTKGAALEGAPAWAPDGSQLVFSRVEGRGRAEHGSLFVVNADGSGMRRLTQPTGSDVDPAWSPDGREIVFARGRRPAISSSDRGGAFDLYAVGADGTGLRRLTATRENERHPDWQPLPAVG